MSSKSSKRVSVFDRLGPGNDDVKPAARCRVRFNRNVITFLDLAVHCNTPSL